MAMAGPSSTGLYNPYAPDQFANPLPVEALLSMSSQRPHGSSHGAMNNGGALPCKREGCAFKGRDRQDLELHMMDRHFIYPTGWEERQKALKSRKRKRGEADKAEEPVKGEDGDASE